MTSTQETLIEIVGIVVLFVAISLRERRRRR